MEVVTFSYCDLYPSKTAESRAELDLVFLIFKM